MDKAPQKSVSNSGIKPHFILLGFLSFGYSVSISVFSCGQYIFSLQVDTTIRCIVVEPAGNMYCNKKKKTLKTRVREHLSCDKNII